MVIQQADKYRSAIIALLEKEKLPVADLPSSLENFFIAIVNDAVAGVAGLEIYGEYGLLRSLAVDKPFGNRGVANGLLTHLEQLAASKKLSEIYLLTDTAAGYFTRKGYDKIHRTEVPKAIQLSAEFSYLCPQSAVVMKKILK